MKNIKEKPTGRVPKSNTAGKIPRMALKKALTEAKEKSRTKLRESASTQVDGSYTAANDTGGMVADTSYSVIKKNTNLTVQQGRKFARKQIEKCRAPTPPVSTVSATNRPGAACCPTQSNTRAVEWICHARGRKEKLLPPKLHRATFAA